MKAYLDNQATTPLDVRVLEERLPLMKGVSGNPHSTAHEFGEAASAALEKARSRIAKAARAQASNIFIVPSATIANNLALLGWATWLEKRGRHIIVSAIEHPSVLESARELGRRGFTVDEAPVGDDGVLDLTRLDALLRPDTVLVSIMAVNNEVGTRQPLDEVADLLADRVALFHCDAAQAAGKVNLDVTSRADLVTLSSHKAYGPVGAAALVVRPKGEGGMKSNMKSPGPLLFGGQQEQGLWPGTANVVAATGFGKALRIVDEDLDSDNERIGGLADLLESGLKEAFPGTVRNGDPSFAVPHCLSLRFKGVSGETLLSRLAAKGIGASFGSACASSTGRPSHVLTAMGLSPADARKTLRFGIGRMTTRKEIEYTLDVARDLSGRFSAAG